MRQLAFAMGIALLVAGCGDDPTEPEVADIGGQWSFTESFSNSSIGVSCQNEGTITINQNGANFSGTMNQQGVCTDSDGNTSDNSGSGSVGGGQVDGNTASFSVSVCEYSGTISGSPPNRISGSVSCTLSFGGTDYPFTGNWTATK